MTFPVYLTTATILLAGVNTLENIPRNIDCREIKTPEGYKFPHGCRRHDFSVQRNKITIATAVNGVREHLPEVISFDDNFIFTKECNDIEINCFNEGQSDGESRLIYRTDKKKTKEWNLSSVDRNISCLDIETQDGYKYPLDCPVGHEITVTNHNQTVIATALHGNISYNSEVMSMDDNSITMKECRDIQIHCFNEDQHVNESWLNYKTKIKHIDPGIATWIIILSVGLIIAVGIFVAVGFGCLYISWKRKIKDQQGAATVSGFLRHLWTHYVLRAKNFCTGESGPRDEECGDPEYAADHVQAEIVMDDIPPQQDGTPGVAHTHRIDSEADGLMPHALSLDLSNKRIQKGHNTAPEEASRYQAMNRNLRGDPGGVNEKEKDDVKIEEANSGCFPPDCGPAADEAEEKPLLSDHRGNGRGSDMTGENAALLKTAALTKTSMAEAEQDSDVESMLELKKSRQYCSA